MPPHRRPPGPAPALAVGLELARAVGALALLPGRLMGDLLRREGRREELLAQLAIEAPLRPDQPSDWPRERPLRAFLSCAEASGEIHAESLTLALRRLLAQRRAPTPELGGLGGPRLARLGVPLLAQPVERASMGFSGPGQALPYWLGVLRDTAAHLRDQRPDVLVAVDSPALHLPLARIAARYGVPTVHFVTPQYWGWAPWRVGPYARAMERALSILPFEAGWFEAHGVRVEHVGHPLLDALAALPSSTPQPDGPLLALLPGSRESVIRRNLPWMLKVVAPLLARLEDARPAVLQEDPAGARLARALVAEAGLAQRVRVLEGPIHGPLAGARAALSVSGTVLLDLLAHRLPTVVLYRLDARLEWARQRLLVAPWIASVNLLARRELLPEFAFAGEGPVEEVRAALERCYHDSPWRSSMLAGLEEASRRLGPPGAAQRAAAAVLEVAAARHLAP